jgi:hypothetical protein
MPLSLPVSVSAKQGVVAAAGVWSGELLATITDYSSWRDAFNPRRGPIWVQFGCTIPRMPLSLPASVSAKQGVVVAAGVWSGDLLSTITDNSSWRDAFAPRRGHLLELDRPVGMPAVKRGMMELSYTKHYSNLKTEPHSSGERSQVGCEAGEGETWG